MAFPFKIITGINPLIVHVPHSADVIPPEIRQSLLLNDNDLRHELLRMTDWHTKELFLRAAQIGGVLFVNQLSRLVMDPERFPRDTDEVMAQQGMGVIYTRTSDGRPLRHEPIHLEVREQLIRHYYSPYSVGFSREVQATIERVGRCLIIDAHSFPSQPLPYELNQDPHRPSICIGTDWFHTPEHLIRNLEDIFARHGLTTARNRPFAGTYVPSKFWRRDPRVVSVMIEIRRDLYMDEQTGEQNENFANIQRILNRIIDQIAHHDYMTPVVCPMPDAWNAIYSRLRAGRERRNAEGIPPQQPQRNTALRHRTLGQHDQGPIPEPPVPLILAAWGEASDQQKQSRWLETLEWARKHQLCTRISPLRENEVHMQTEA